MLTHRLALMVVQVAAPALGFTKLAALNSLRSQCKLSSNCEEPWKEQSAGQEEAKRAAPHLSASTGCVGGCSDSALGRAPCQSRACSRWLASRVSPSVKLHQNSSELPPSHGRGCGVCRRRK
jgi:hypothetical protein